MRKPARTLYAKTDANNDANIDLTSPENRVSNVTPPILLTPLEVAARLRVSEKTAIRIMRELLHVNVSMDMYSGKNESESRRKPTRILLTASSAGNSREWEDAPGAFPQIQD